MALVFTFIPLSQEYQQLSNYLIFLSQHPSWLVVGKLMNKFDLNQITNKNDINQLLSSQIIYLESILKMNTSKINY